MIDLIWDDDPPETARALVQTYVASLRRSFAAAGLPGDVIVTRPPGYAIDVPADTVDLEVFQRLLHFFHALNRFRELGDPLGEAATLAQLGITCREAGRLAEGLHFLDRAVRLFQTLGEQTGIAYARRLSGSVRLEQGAYAQARSDFGAALSAYRGMKNQRGEGLTLRSLCLHHRALGQLDEARQWLEDAAGIWRRLEAPHWLARTERDLALVHAANNDRQKAAQTLARAMTVFRDHGCREYRELTALTEKFRADNQPDAHAMTGVWVAGVHRDPHRSTIEPTDGCGPMMPRCEEVSGLRIPVIECGEPLVELCDQTGAAAARFGPFTSRRQEPA